MSNRLSLFALLSAIALAFSGCMQTLPTGNNDGVPPLDGDDAQDTTGDDATGDDTTGDDATGDDTTGDDATGDDPTGDDPTGDDTTGDDTTDGSRPGGDPPPHGDDDDDGNDPSDGTTPTGPCNDDSFEDNDDLATATIFSGDPITNLVSCPDDDDWYAIDMNENESLMLDLTFLDDDGDIDVQFQDATGATLMSGSSASDNENVNITATTAGAYYVRVHLFADAGVDVGNPYSIAVSEPPTCPSDSFETNQTEANAAAISVGAYPSLNVCEMDEDWYAIDAAAGQSIAVMLNFLHAEGDVDATLYTPTGGWAVSGTSVTDNEELGPYTVTEAGVHTLRVRLYSDNGSSIGNSYDLDVTVN